MRVGPIIAALPLFLLGGCSRLGFRELPDAAAPRAEAASRDGSLDTAARDAPALERGSLEIPTLEAQVVASDAARDAARDQPPAKDLLKPVDKPKLAPDTRPPDTRPPDTRPPDTRPPDTRPPDTRPPDSVSTPDLPATVGNIVIATSTTETVSCATGQTAVGGGGNCTGGNLISSVPHLGGWRADCSTGTTAISAYAVCVGAPLATAISIQTVTSGAAAFDVPCPGTDRLIGGGCQCAGGTVLHGSAPWSNASWRCACSAAGAHSGYAICIPLPLALSLGVGRVGTQSNVTQPTMTCPSATPKALGGGCYSGGSPPGTSVQKSAPSGGTGWFCKLAAVFSNSAWAMCAK